MSDPYGVGALVGGISGGITDYAGYAIQKSGASAASRHAREFAERVMRNQIQWRMKDMQRAGLNPVLAAGGGSGGTVNPGQTQVPDAPRGSIDGTAILNSARAGGKYAMEKSALAKQNEILSAGADKARADAVRADHEAFISGNEASASIGLMDRQRKLYEAALAKSVADVGLTTATQGHTERSNRLMDINLPGQLYDAKVDNSALGRGLKWTRPVTGAVGDVSGAIGGFLAGRAIRTRQNAEMHRSSAGEGMGAYPPGRSRGGATYQRGNEYFDSRTGEVFE